MRTAHARRLVALALAPALALPVAGCGSGSDTPLHEAAARGDAAAVRAHVETAGRPDDPGRNGWRPLHRAARGGHVEVLRLLLRAGADADARDAGPNGWTPLMHALHKNQIAAVDFLIASGADVDAATGSGTTALIMAAGYGQRDIVRRLLEAGADPRAETARGRNALWAAAGGGAVADFTDGPPLGTCFPEVVDELLARAPDLRLRGGFETRLLSWFARSPRCRSLLAALPTR